MKDQAYFQALISSIAQETEQLEEVSQKHKNNTKRVLNLKVHYHAVIFRSQIWTQMLIIKEATQSDLLVL